MNLEENKKLDGLPFPSEQGGMRFRLNAAGDAWEQVCEKLASKILSKHADSGMNVNRLMAYNGRLCYRGTNVDPKKTHNVY